MRESPFTQAFPVAPSVVERALCSIGMSRSEAKHVMARGLFADAPPVPISAVERVLCGLGLTPPQARAVMAQGFSAIRRRDAERDPVAASSGTLGVAPFDEAPATKPRDTENER